MSQRASEKQPARPQIIEEDAAPPAYHDALHEGSSISSSELSTSTMTDSTFTYDSLPSEASSSSQIGSHPALPVDTKMPLQGNFACLMLVTSDKLRAIAFPPETRALIQMAIRNGWPLGIQEEGELGKTAYSYKLRGKPCALQLLNQLTPGSGQNMETIASRRLITHLLAALSSTGWHVTMAAELDKKDSSLDSIFFKSGDPLARTFFSVSFSGWDKIRLIDSPNEAVRLRFLRVIQVGFTSSANVSRGRKRCRSSRRKSPAFSRSRWEACRGCSCRRRWRSRCGSSWFGCWTRLMNWATNWLRV